MFTPSAGTPGSSTITTFTLSDTSTAGTSASPGTVTVTDTDAAAPTITVLTPTVTTTEDAAVKPFATVTVADSNVGRHRYAHHRAQRRGATGKLSGSTDLGGGGGGVYTLTGAATTISQDLEGLVFTPRRRHAGLEHDHHVHAERHQHRRYQRQSRHGHGDRHRCGGADHHGADADPDDHRGRGG